MFPRIQLWRLCPSRGDGCVKIPHYEGTITDAVVLLILTAGCSSGPKLSAAPIIDAEDQTFCGLVDSIHNELGDPMQAPVVFNEQGEAATAAVRSKNPAIHRWVVGPEGSLLAKADPVVLVYVDSRAQQVCHEQGWSGGS